MEKIFSLLLLLLASISHAEMSRSSSSYGTQTAVFLDSPALTTAAVQPSYPTGNNLGLFGTGDIIATATIIAVGLFFLSLMLQVTWVFF